MAKNYFDSRNFGGSFGGSDSRGSSKSGSKNSSDYLEANRVIENIVEKQEKIITDVANAIAVYAISCNKNGAASTKSLSEEMDKLLRNFSVDVRAEIYNKAIAMIIVNL